MKLSTSFKQSFVNWLFSNVTIERIMTMKTYVIGGSTFYCDYLDLDHQSSDPSPTESLVWYNSTDHVLRYYNGTDTVDC